MKTTEVVIAEQKVMDYVEGLTPLQVKKVIFAMTLLKGDERLSESPVAELRTIASLYDGIINAKFAKDLATRVAKAYSEKHPRTLLTKKEMDAYTNAVYTPLKESLGLFGFDYVISTLRNTKAYIVTPNSGVDEIQMIKAMRWEERREDWDKEQSNLFHWKKGLEYAGFGDMAEYLAKCVYIAKDGKESPFSFALANIYELVQSSSTYVADVASKPEKKQASVRQMKMHFIQKADQINAFYEAKAPELPNGYNEEELIAGGHIHKFAERGLLLNSKEVLAYFKAMEEYNAVISGIQNEFSKEEVQFIFKNRDCVTYLIANEW